MTDYVGFENFIDFVNAIPDQTIMHIGKHNDSLGETICTAAWKDAESDIVYYYRAVANNQCLTPVEFHDKLSAANEEGPEAENKVAQQGTCSLLIDMKEVIEYLTSAATIGFIPGLFSFPANLEPEPLLVNESVFEDDVSEILEDIDDLKIDGELNATYQKLLKKESTDEKEEN